MLLAMLMSEYAAATRLRSELGNLLGVLKAGVKLSLLGRPALSSLRLSAGFFWVAAAAEVLLGIALILILMFA